MPPGSKSKWSLSMMEPRRLDNDKILIPRRAVSEDGRVVGDAFFEIGPDDPEYAEAVADLELIAAREKRRQSLSMMEPKRLDNGKILVPRRAVSETGTVGDAFFEIGPDDPEYAEAVADLELIAAREKRRQTAAATKTSESAA
jgi:hypothetical protein